MSLHPASEDSITHPPVLRRMVVLAVVFLIALAAQASDSRHQVRIEGHGTRTVVLEAGLGDTMDVWRGVQSRIAAGCARTLAYTRAGYPGSDAAGGRRDAATIVTELRSELRRRGIHSPYVLVGHSLGGLYMQYFARQYPDEVEGLLLLDSSHWNQQLLLPDARREGFARGTTVLFMPWIMRREILDSIRAGQQVISSPDASALPTIVLSRTRSLGGESSAAQALAESQQDEIAAAFPAARHVRVAGSGHYIQLDRPEVVVAAARELAGCAPLTQAAQLPAGPANAFGH